MVKNLEENPFIYMEFGDIVILLMPEHSRLSLIFYLTQAAGSDGLFWSVCCIVGVVLNFSHFHLLLQNHRAKLLNILECREFSHPSSQAKPPIRLLSSLGR